MKKITCLLAFIAAVGYCLVSSAQAKYNGGTGEPNNPYKIATAEDLNDIGNHVEDFNKCFVLVADINLTAYTGTAFNIIGDDTNNFTGVFDGNGHTISNFTYESEEADYIGLFSVVNGVNAAIKDLTLVDPNIHMGICCPGGGIGGSLAAKVSDGATVCHCSVEGGIISGDSSIGGLVGENFHSVISDCYASIKVEGYGGGSNIGGLVGHSENYGPELEAIISNCYATGPVLGGDHVGGLVGDNKGMISNCYATGSVTGSGEQIAEGVGGLVGQSEAHFVTDDMLCIVNCYATGTVDGNNGIGGLVGWQSGGVISDCYATGNTTGSSGSGGLIGDAGATTVQNCYAAGNIDGSNYVGGLIGEDHGSSYTGNFWNSDINPTLSGVGNLDPDPSGVIGKSTAELQKESTFTDAGWDFVDIWDIGENQTYPFLQRYPAGDLNHDGRVDFIDFSIFASHWLAGTTP